MRPVSLIVALTIPLLGALSVAAPRARAQARDTVNWRTMGARRCARADTLFGRLWRSHQSIVQVRYSPGGDTTSIRTPHRNLSWQPISSRLVASESVVRIPGQLRTVDSARIELHLGFVDSIYRTPEQSHLSFQIDDSVHFEIDQPQVEYLMGVKTHGIPLLVTALLTPEQSLALARAREVKGTMGPFPFLMYSFELWEINTIYRASFCGVE
jgi:hypothetical protein